MNKRLIFILSPLILMSFYLAGCATLPPPATRNAAKGCLENCLGNCFIPQKETIENGALKRSYPADFEKVWESALLILQQYAVVNSISKKDGIISYIDTDGILLNKAPVYCDFPFVVLIEKSASASTAYIYPIKESSFLGDQKLRAAWKKEIEKGFSQKQEDFLEQLGVQIEGKERWGWFSPP